MPADAADAGVPGRQPLRSPAALRIGGGAFLAGEDEEGMGDLEEAEAERGGVDGGMAARVAAAPPQYLCLILVASAEGAPPPRVPPLRGSIRRDRDSSVRAR